MAEKFNLQDRFLNILRINKIEVKIYLEGGFQTSGVVRSFDDYTVLLEKNGEQSLVYKHAVKMMVPSKYIKLFQEPPSKDE
ncbi:RNA-binding protein Hfq [Petrotoga sp. HKA.pet.4.5]|jgi:host factor-I protein|uniref:RNA chaperone Hfq n=1 Tax=unclassified Petrotoga TaxID=2620614 RepID=UPI000CB043E2|nr:MULTISPECIES: RNA chaperone Hfq [unclassified Petrotoga]MDK2812316.1 host factor-I protein [Petrotoga sp.]MBL5981408.1 RNA-binding protein Hfq [Petrotoga sp. 8T1HF07.NaAc.6.1]PNR90047.1 RNA-binding protein Hfq [Petrotoga sp. 9T1HF07.CasAA.8.2]RLL85348.1 RNA-binding protein Hfq [Petrotoga sp. Shatin.DS.tank11.9.2.9.3]RLL88952.1 RNA-binding protein Hfq [Petrotoga sp. HKA.pet.4.5]